MKSLAGVLFSITLLICSTILACHFENLLYALLGYTLSFAIATKFI